MDESSYSTFGGLIGGVAGSIWGPVGGAVGSFFGSSIGSLFGSHKKAKRQREEAQQYLNLVNEQSRLLREKIKADNANLYSAVQSSIAQTSGAMGAVY